MYGSAIFDRPSDEVARNAVVTADSGTLDTDTNYGVAALTDDNPARLCKFTSLAGSLKFTYAAAQRVDLVALFHTAFDAGQLVQVYANNTGVRGVPVLTANFTIPAWLGSGTGRWPVNPFLDLRTATGYTTAGYKYWWIVWAAGTQNAQIGQVRFTAQVRTLDPGLEWGVIISPMKRMVENMTAYGVTTVYSRGTTQWRIDAGIRQLTQAQKDAWDAQWYDADGRAKPFTFIPDADVNAAYLVRRADNQQSRTAVFINVYDERVTLEEVARGLRPGV